MAESVSTPRIAARLLATLENAIDDGDSQSATASVSLGFNLTPNTTLTSGTSANQFDKIWHDSDRTLAASASETIDLYDLGAIDVGGGAGKTALGQNWQIAELVALLIHVSATTSGTLLVGGEGSAAAWNSLFNGSDTAQIGPFGADAFILITNHGVDPAFDVTDTSNHLLQFTEAGGANSVTYSIAAAGRSA